MGGVGGDAGGDELSAAVVVVGVSFEMSQHLLAKYIEHSLCNMTSLCSGCALSSQFHHIKTCNLCPAVGTASTQLDRSSKTGGGSVKNKPFPKLTTSHILIILPHVIAGTQSLSHSVSHVSGVLGLPVLDQTPFSWTNWTSGHI